MYLIGGDYERLYYTFSAKDTETDSQAGKMMRIRLDVEVTEMERRKQNVQYCADPEYKNMLDFLLKKRMNNILENTENWLATCAEIEQLKPILSGLGKDAGFTEELLDYIEQVSWLKQQIHQMAASRKNQLLLKLPEKGDLRATLKAIGYPLFVWLIPYWCCETIHARTNRSLGLTLTKIRQLGRLTAGATARLCQDMPVSGEEKWLIYILPSINLIPLMLLVNCLNDQLLRMLSEQRTTLEQEKNTEKKFAVLNYYSLAGDAMRDILTMDEFIKPCVIESLQLNHFDVNQYLRGYQEDHPSPPLQCYAKARAYALYCQLFKSGRIQVHETAIFLKKYQITRQTLATLNGLDLTALPTHIELFRQLHAPLSAAVPGNSNSSAANTA